MIRLRSSALVVLLLGTAACNSSGTASNESMPAASEEESAPVAAEETSQATASAPPANLPNSFTPAQAAQSAIARSFTTNTSGLSSSRGSVIPKGRPSVALSGQENAAGETEWIVTLDGTTHTLGPDQFVQLAPRLYQKSRTTVDGVSILFESLGGAWSTINSGGYEYDNVVPISIQTTYDRNGSSFVDRSFGVFGKITPSDDVPMSGTARFTGDVYAFELSTQAAARTTFSGDVELDVDFARSSVSGKMDNFIDSLGLAIPGRLTVTPTTIANGTFVSDLTLSGAGAATLSQSALNGRFYGDAAQEAGGDFSYVTRVGGVNTAVGVGAFVADR